MICHIHEKAPSKLLGKIIVRISSKSRGRVDAELYPGVIFVEEKLIKSNLRSTLSRLGVAFKGEKECDLEKAVANGDQLFLKTVHKGLGAFGDRLTIC